ncbi:MAG: acetyl ornithine aminotransferase family protein [Chloroflexi bacterium]|nr:acetyl ornithine aminotransferase family protein [Chloroflexota bacterium]
MAAQSIIVPPPGPKAKAILERDARVLSPSYARDYPFVMDHGLGAQVWDVDGNRYIDFSAGIAVNSTGHSHPEVVKAIQEQAARYIHISSDYYHELMVRVGERIDELAPMKEGVTVFLANSGTESVEAAIKLARYATGRRQFIGFLGAFHGRSMGSLSFTASKARQQERFFPTMPGVWHVPFPDPYHPVFPIPPGGDEGDAVVDYIEGMLFPEALPPDEVAAIVVEPIQGEGGYVVPPPHFFPRLRELCDRHGILLIDDEVQAGVGRTGKWWAIQHWGVEPDIMCIAKGIASGVPMGATASRRSVGAKWKPGAPGNTYGGNPLACVSALKTLELIENGYMQNAAETGSYMLDALEEMQSRHPVIGQVRGRGLMIGVELVLDRESKEPARELRNALVHRCFEQGLLTLGCGRSTIRFMPPLMIPKELAQEGLEVFEQALTEVETGHRGDR